jgi:hypothetical protein
MRGAPRTSPYTAGRGSTPCTSSASRRTSSLSGARRRSRRVNSTTSLVATALVLRTRDQRTPAWRQRSRHTVALPGFDPTGGGAGRCAGLRSGRPGPRRARVRAWTAPRLRRPDERPRHPARSCWGGPGRVPGDRQRLRVRFNGGMGGSQPAPHRLDRAGERPASPAARPTRERDLNGRPGRDQLRRRRALALDGIAHARPGFWSCHRHADGLPAGAEQRSVPVRDEDAVVRSNGAPPGIAHRVLALAMDRLPPAGTVRAGKRCDGFPAGGFDHRHVGDGSAASRRGHHDRRIAAPVGRSPTGARFAERQQRSRNGRHTNRSATQDRGSAAAPGDAGRVHASRTPPHGEPCVAPERDERSERTFEGAFGNPGGPGRPPTPR